MDPEWEWLSFWQEDVAGHEARGHVPVRVWAIGTRLLCPPQSQPLVRPQGQPVVYGPIGRRYPVPSPRPPRAGPPVVASRPEPEPVRPEPPTARPEPAAEAARPQPAAQAARPEPAAEAARPEPVEATRPVPVKAASSTHAEMSAGSGLARPTLAQAVAQAVAPKAPAPTRVPRSQQTGWKNKVAWFCQAWLDQDWPKCDQLHAQYTMSLSDQTNQQGQWIQNSRNLLHAYHQGNWEQVQRYVQWSLGLHGSFCYSFKCVF